MKTSYLAVILAFTATVALACSKDDPKRANPQQAYEPEKAVDLVQARTLFNERCANCHGADGMGNGPGAATLMPKPRNYHDKAWQASVNDDQIRMTIKLGGAAVGKSPIMPSSPDLESKPEVVEGLLKIIRQFGS